LIEAVEHYRAVAEHKAATFAQKRQARDAIKKLEPRIPRLTIVAPSGFVGRVRVDDVELPAASLGTAIEVNPGTRVVTAQADGFKPFETTVVMGESSQRTVRLELEPLPARSSPAESAPRSPAPASHSNTWAYVSLATGTVGVVVGTVFGLAARKTREELRDECLNDVCSEDRRDKYDRGKMQADISTAGFVVGGVGIGVGAYLLLTADHGAERSNASGLYPVVGPSQVGLRGVF
jgi:hypothetical protein